MYTDFDIDKELAEHTEEDYLSGFLPVENINPEEDWRPYLTTQEYQARDYETWSCVTFSILKCFQAIVYKKYGEKLNLAERFLAVISGTTANGNSIKAVAQAFRDKGTVKEELYPFPETYSEWREMPPQELFKVAMEFIPKRYDFRYERINSSTRHDFLKCSPLLISSPAWYKEGNVYIRPKGMRDNHATVEPVKMKANDTYEPFEKDIDFEPMVAYRFHVVKKKSIIKLTLWEKLRELWFIKIPVRLVS